MPILNLNYTGSSVTNSNQQISTVIINDSGIKKLIAFVTGPTGPQGPSGYNGLDGTGVINLSGYITTGTADLRYYPLGSNPSGYLTTVDPNTLTGSFYPLNSNPSGYVTTTELEIKTGELVTYIEDIINSSGYLTTGQAAAIYYPSSNPSGFITGVNTGYLTGYVLRSETGQFASVNSLNETGTHLINYFNSGSGYLQAQFDELGNLYYPLSGNPSGYINNAGLTGLSGQLYDLIEQLNNTTGNFYLNSNPSGFTTIIVLSGASGVLQAQINSINNDLNNYYLASNPSGYITGFDSGQYITTGQTGQFASFTQLTGASGYLFDLINGSSAGVSLLNGLSGSINILGTGNVFVSVNSQSILISGSGGNTIVDLSGYITTGDADGRYYPLSANPSGYLDTLSGLSLSLISGLSGALDLSIYQTGSYLYNLTTGISGYLNDLISNNSAGVISINGVSGNITIWGTGSNTVTVSGQNIYISGAATPVDLSGYITTGNADLRYYPLETNPSGYLTNLSGISIDFITGASGILQDQVNNLDNNTGNYYLSSNPSGYITGFESGIYITTGETGQFASQVNLTGLSGYLISLIDAASAGVATLNGISGNITLQGSGNISVSTNGQTIVIFGDQSGYITTGDADDRYYPLHSNPSGYALQSNLELTGSNLNSQINALSGYAYSPSNPDYILFITGDQQISGIKSIVSGLDFDTLNAPPHKEGRLFYSTEDHALTYYNEQNDVAINIGQETVFRAVNKFGSQINNGTVVYISGAQGNRPQIYPAIASQLSSTLTVGIATHDIPDNQNGYVTVQGVVRGLNLTGFNVGDTVYLSDTISGQYRTTEPPAPNRIIKIGSVLNNSATTGAILVHISNVVYDLTHLNDVFFNSGSLKDYDILTYITGSGTWTNISRSAILSGYITTGSADNRYYPLSTNPSGYITGFDSGIYITTGQTGQFASQVGLTGLSGYLIDLIDAASAGVSSINGASGVITLQGSGLTSVNTNGQTITVFTDLSGYITTGQADLRYYLNSNPSGYLNSLSGLSISFITGASGILQDQINSSSGQLANYYLASNPSGYINTLSGLSVNFVTGASGILQNQISILNNATGNYYLNSNPSGFITNFNLTGASGSLQDQITLANSGVKLLNNLTGAINIIATGSNTLTLNGSDIIISGAAIPVDLSGYLTTGQADLRYYPLTSNPSGYLNSLSGLSVGFVTGASGILQSQINSTSGQLLNYYLASNPSGYLNTLSGLSIDFVTGASGVLQNQINSTSGQLSNYYLASNPSGYLNSLSGLSVAYVSGASGILQSQINSTSGQLTNYYLNSNPSGYLNTLSGLSVEYVSGASGVLQNQINGINNSIVTSINVSGELVTGSVLFTGIGGTIVRLNGRTVEISGAGSSSTTNISSQFDSNRITLPTGVNNYAIQFTNGFGGIPVVVGSLEHTGLFPVIATISGITTGGFNILFSDNLTEDQYYYNYIAISGNLLNIFPVTGAGGTGSVSFADLTGASGVLQSQITTLNNATGNYYLNSNPSGFITNFNLTGASGALQSQITLANSGVKLLNGLTGAINIVATGSNFLTINGSNIIISGAAIPVDFSGYITTGQADLRYYPLQSNPSGYLNTLSGLSIDYVSGASGILQGQINSTSGQLSNYYLASNPSGYLNTLSGLSVAFVTGSSGILQGQINSTSGQLINYYLASNPSGYLNTLSGLSVAFVTGASGVLQNQINSTSGQLSNYYLVTNPSGYLNTLSGLSVAYVTGISGALQSQITTLNNATGNYYLNSNPSGFVTNFNLTGSSGVLQNQINNLNIATGTLQSAINSINNNNVTGILVSGLVLTGAVYFTGIGGTLVRIAGNTIEISGAGGDSGPAGNSPTSQFRSDRLLLPTGVNFYQVTFSGGFTGVPVVVGSLEYTGLSPVIATISGINTGGFYVTFSDNLGRNQYYYNYIAISGNLLNLIAISGGGGAGDVTYAQLTGASGSLQNQYDDLNNRLILTGQKIKKKGINFSINSTSIISTGFKSSFTLPYSANITGWAIVASNTGKLLIDITKTTYDDFPNNNLSITNNFYPQLNNQLKNIDSTQNWSTTGLNEGDILSFYVLTGLSGITSFNLFIGIL